MKKIIVIICGVCFVLIPFIMSSCDIYPTHDIHHVNGTKDSLFIYCDHTYPLHPSSTKTAFDMFSWIKPGETHIRTGFEYDIQRLDWEIVVLTDSTYNSYSEDYLREHDIYDKKWQISYSKLEDLNFVIAIVKVNGELKILNYDD